MLVQGSKHQFSLGLSPNQRAALIAHPRPLCPELSSPWAWGVLLPGSHLATPRSVWVPWTWWRTPRAASTAAEAEGGACLSSVCSREARGSGPWPSWAAMRPSHLCGSPPTDTLLCTHTAHPGWRSWAGPRDGLTYFHRSPLEMASWASEALCRALEWPLSGVGGCFLPRAPRASHSQTCTGMPQVHLPHPGRQPAHSDHC